MESAERFFLDRRVLGRRALATLRKDERRTLSPLGRTLERAIARKRGHRESRHGLHQLLLFSPRLPANERCEVSRGWAARGRAFEGALQSADPTRRRVERKRRRHHHRYGDE